MRSRRAQLTDAQEAMIGHLDDVAEHVHCEFDPDEYTGASTIGFAHIGNIDGRGSFVHRIKSLSNSEHPMVLYDDRRDSYNIKIGGLELSLRKDSYRGGYRLSITNVTSFRSGPEHQRLDVRERLHRLVLERLRSHGYLDDARVYTRVD